MTSSSSTATRLPRWRLTSTASNSQVLRSDRLTERQRRESRPCPKEAGGAAAKRADPAASAAAAAYCPPLVIVIVIIIAIVIVPVIALVIFSAIHIDIIVGRHICSHQQFHTTVGDIRLRLA